jgi:hypothetical protein
VPLSAEIACNSTESHEHSMEDVNDTQQTADPSTAEEPSINVNTVGMCCSDSPSASDKARIAWSQNSVTPSPLSGVATAVEVPLLPSCADACMQCVTRLDPSDSTRLDPLDSTGSRQLLHVPRPPDFWSLNPLDPQQTLCRLRRLDSSAPE